MPSKLTPAAQLADIRARITQIQADSEALPAQPLPAADALARLDAWIRDQAARFDPARAARAFTTAGAPLGKVLEAHGGRTGENSVSVDLGAVLCAMFGPEIKRRMASVIENETTAGGPSLAERAALIERWTAELEALEFQEEGIIRAAEDAGERLARRPDARPEIVLAP
jgi:hypothetical protein